MARWHGKYYRGASRNMRNEKRREAVARQERFAKTIQVGFDPEFGMFKAEMPRTPGLLALGATAELAVNEFRKLIKAEG